MPLRIATASAPGSRQICYILGFEPSSAQWLHKLSKSHNVNIVGVTGMDWDNGLTPWPAPGVPNGSPDFKGDAKATLDALTGQVIPAAERHLGIDQPVRTLAGISLSGLFTLWQWMLCDTFTNIISLSGSFWYQNFVKWMQSTPFPAKPAGARAFFSLGRQEPLAKVPQFRSVGTDTQQIVELVKSHLPDTMFMWEPGGHYTDYEPRMLHAFDFIYKPHVSTSEK